MNQVITAVTAIAVSWTVGNLLMKKFPTVIKTGAGESKNG